MPGPPRRLLPLLLLVCLLVPSSGGNGLKALVRYHAMPLIQTLLEQGPQEPGTALRSDLNTQHLHFMMDLYRRSADSDGRPRNGRQVGAAVRLVRPITQASVPTDGHWHIQKLTFGLQGVITAEELVRASVMHPRATHITNACISTKVRLLTKSGPSLRSKISNANHMFVETDLTSYLKPLIQEPEKTFKLELHIICRKIRMRPAYLMDVNQSDVPFLLLYLNHTIHPVSREGRIHEDHKGEPNLLIRRPRQAGSLGIKLPKFSNQSAQSKNQCVLRPFWVSFHQLGWDHWIIAPHRYNPGFCKGDCPRILHSGYNSPNHAIIQNFINQVVDGSVPRPSCVPYSYGPISVLMIEPEGKILYKEYENMMAESCTCR